MTILYVPYVTRITTVKGQACLISNEIVNSLNLIWFGPASPDLVAALPVRQTVVHINSREAEFRGDHWHIGSVRSGRALLCSMFDCVSQ